MFKFTKSVKRFKTWDRRREIGDMRQESWDRRRETGDVILEMWDRRRKIGDLRQDTWDVRQETRDVRQEKWDRRPETRDGRQETGDLRQATWDMRQETDYCKNKRRLFYHGFRAETSLWNCYFWSCPLFLLTFRSFMVQQIDLTQRCYTKSETAVPRVRHEN